MKTIEEVMRDGGMKYENARSAFVLTRSAGPCPIFGGAVVLTTGNYFLAVPHLRSSRCTDHGKLFVDRVPSSEVPLY